MNKLVFLLAVLALAGCDKLTGAADQKIADAEAIGFACRVSHKTPEDCMKENEAQSPSSILDGWKSADEDIKDGKLDPKMNNVASPTPESEAGAEGEAKPEGGGDKPAEDKAKTAAKPADEKAGAKKEEKPAEMKKDDKLDAKRAGDMAKKPVEAVH